ncbi:MAG: IS1380 family transposase [Balneolaceae bacterium]|nr:IS1380 family transposase [Balneolaceae bacterium]
MHITKSSDKITPFGGLDFCLESFHTCGLAGLIDRHLGPRGQMAGFSYSDIVANLMSVLFTGGDCAEDLADHLREPLHRTRGLSPCSPDTLLRGVKQLACDSHRLTHPTSGVNHTFNINEPLNELLVKALRTTGQLSNRRCYTLDYDNKVIETEKWDAVRTYKKCTGYQPGVASIEGMPVSIEGRNGNSQASFAQHETLDRLFERLNTHDVSIGRFRADSASYQQDVVDLVQTHTNQFYIRAKRSAEMLRQIGALDQDDWRSVKLNWQPMDVAELADWRPFDGQTSYRLIVSRIKRDDQQGDLFSESAYTYRAILTNDRESSPEEIVAFYNKRGASERIFDIMGNDFSWSRLPCSFLSQNTAFMILTAIIANFYRYILSLYSKRIPWLKVTYRLKKFIFRFISVPAKWIRSGRQNILKLYTGKGYELLLE